MLVCGAAVEECVYEAVRVQRHGELRVTFSPDLKIAAYEFNLSHTSQYFSQSFVQEETEELLKACIIFDMPTNSMHCGLLDTILQPCKSSMNLCLGRNC